MKSEILRRVLPLSAKDFGDLALNSFFVCFFLYFPLLSQFNAIFTHLNTHINVRKIEGGMTNVQLTRNESECNESGSRAVMSAVAQTKYGSDSYFLNTLTVRAWMYEVMCFLCCCWFDFFIIRKQALWNLKILWGAILSPYFNANNCVFMRHKFKQPESDVVCIT